jgi:FixJ family two-component response regulator
MNLSTQHRRVASEIVDDDSIPTVCVIHDDASTRGALEILILGRGWRARTYSHARAFLAQKRVLVPSCLVLDVNLPDHNGLDVQQLVLDRRELPIVFISGCGDISAAVRAMKAGAVEFFVKPFSDHEILNAIERAIGRSATVLRHEAKVSALLQLYTRLTRREREVMDLVVSGRRNKEVAGTLGISEATVKAHRGRLMQKMKAGSFAELVRMAVEVGFGGARLAFTDRKGAGAAPSWRSSFAGLPGGSLGLGG